MKRLLDSYDEHIKNPQEKHARINLNTGESYEPPSMGELIEKQIEEAASYLAALERANQRTGRSAAIDAVFGFCERLLQVIQNQQAQIEELRARTKSLEFCVAMKTVEGGR